MTPCRSMAATSSGDEEDIDATTASGSSVSPVTAILLLPSWATRYTTFVTPMPETMAARSTLPTNHFSTSTTLWVMTIRGSVAWNAALVLFIAQRWFWSPERSRGSGRSDTLSDFGPRLDHP